MFEIKKVQSVYELTNPSGVTTKLFLVTSVAFYKAKILDFYLRWKVEGDEVFLKQLIRSAEANPNKETFKALTDMEIFYREFQGLVNQETTSEEKVKAIRQANYQARHDVSNALTMSPMDLQVDNILTLTQLARRTADVAETTFVTMGDLADEKSRVDGANRTRHTKKKNKKT